MSDSEEIEERSGEASYSVTDMSDSLPNSSAYLDDKYSLDFKNHIDNLSSTFASAHNVTVKKGKDDGSKLYALMFHRNFPVRMDVLKQMFLMSSPSIQSVIDYGKITAEGGNEYFIVILQRPIGRPIAEYVAREGQVEELFAVRNLFEQLFNILSTLTEHNILHGCINPHTLYYDDEMKKLWLSEPISNFCGFAQETAYESIDRVVCHPAGKGESDRAADYYALGVLILYIITGIEPLGNLPGSSAIINARMEHGSPDAMLEYLKQFDRQKISARIVNLIRGLTTDDQYDRWGASELRLWAMRKESAAPVSRLHRIANSTILLGETEYSSRKYLAHDLFRGWDQAKRSIKISEFGRWAGIALKKPEIARDIDRITPIGYQEMITPDEKLAQLIMILDPDGPIRFQDISCSIYGIGSFLAYSYIKGERHHLTQIGKIFHEDLVEHWISKQPDASDYGYSTLMWSPQRVKEFLRRKEGGFGMERALYEMNEGLCCQSGMLEKYFCSTISETLLALEDIASDKFPDSDPLDRHIAAFIGNRVNLNEEVQIKTLRNYSYVARNPSVVNVALMAIAKAVATRTEGQEAGNLRSLKNLCMWLEARLQSVVDALRSKSIKKELAGNIKAAAKTGDIKKIYDVISHPAYVKKDTLGFLDARKQYREAAMEISQIQDKGQLERTAYRSGLTYAVWLSYAIAMITILVLMLRGR